MSENILAHICADKRNEVAALKEVLPLDAVHDRALTQPPTRDFTAALRNVRPRGTATEAHIIAEVKRRSPSKGEFPWHGDAARQARDYEAGGARAISVVTDELYFGGSIGLLQEVRRATTLSVLQKEFVLEPWQVYHARAIGADAVLLIAACLPGGLLEDMAGIAREVGLHTLVEVVDRDEMVRAGRANAQVVGVNNRDLRTFETDPAHTLALLPEYDDEQVAVTESGIHTREDVERMLAAGVDAFLIGEALMTAPDPAAQLRWLRGEAPQPRTEVPATAEAAP